MSLLRVAVSCNWRQQRGKPEYKLELLSEDFSGLLMAHEDTALCLSSNYQFFCCWHLILLQRRKLDNLTHQEILLQVRALCEKAREILIEESNVQVRLTDKHPCLIMLVRPC